MHRRGVGTALADNYAGHYLVLEKGPKVFKLQLGERTDVVSREKAEATRRASATCGRRASTQGGGPPGEAQDLPGTSEDLRGVV